MAMPLDLVLVRHGESEGNVARSLSEKGDDSVFTEQFRDRHSSEFRLTDRGIEQAKQAGKWIRNNFKFTFDRYMVSGFARAMETAAHLKLPRAVWDQDFYLRERDMGDFDIMPEAEKQAKYEASYRAYQRDPFYWTPPNGESVAQLCLRVDRVLQTLHRECEGMRVIIVCHGMVMWAFRIRLERLTPAMFLAQSQDQSGEYRIRNCQIIHYTRVMTGMIEPSKRYDYVRFVCPWDETFSPYRRIFRPKFTNEQLLAEAEKSERILSV